MHLTVFVPAPPAITLLSQARLMKAIDDVIRNVPAGGTIVVKAATLGMSEAAFHRMAMEIQDDDGIDDFDFVKAHRLGDSEWQQMEQDSQMVMERRIDALTLRRWKS
jgi:hypothetical protein